MPAIDFFDDLRNEIMKADQRLVGFDIGTNVGEAAGQTIFHCHIHLIPRRKDDVENPRGGIRHVIPGKADYHYQQQQKSPGLQWQKGINFKCADYDCKTSNARYCG